jgi:hypothetical protein
MAGSTEAGSARAHSARAGSTGAGDRPAAGPAATHPTAAAPAFCQASQTVVASAPGWLVPDSGHAELIPLGVSANGRDAYVSAWTAGFAGVAELDLRTGRLRPIQQFGNPAEDQADGVSAGRWLVWADTYSLDNLDRFTVYSFDAATGRVRRIGRSLSAADGTAWPSPWHAPAVSGNYAAWAQGYGPGVVEIRLADLVTGVVETVVRGHVQPPFFDGSLLVWPQSAAANGQTGLRAYSVTAHARATLPPVLAGVHDSDFVVTDGRRTAYLDPQYTGLYYSPAQDVPARLIVRLPPGVDFTDLALAPGTLAWTTSDATYLASTKTGAFVQVTPEYGYATGSTSVMLITDAPSQKAPHSPLPTYVVNPASFAWPSC